MATKAPKLTLSPSRDIPFNKLVLSQANVRRVKAGLSIEELAEDIARRTMLQSLSVRPLLDAEGAETGLYEVPAGGRRFRALELLVKQKRLAKTTAVPCVVRDPGTDILAEDDSLAENVQRAPLHPLDQYRAFQTMRAKGMAEEEIAAAFFVPVAVVQQRLRLASVSDRLLDIYAEDGMTLKQLMAFTISNDHARQEQVWESLPNILMRDPYQIRRLLTERTVRASDKRARFVGVDTYEAAGGTVLRDLFEIDFGGWLQDVALLERLVADKLQRVADEVAAEGWKWVETAVTLPYDHAYDLRQLTGTAAALSEAECARLKALNDEHVELEAAHEGADELPDEVDARFGEIEAELAAFENRPLRYDPQDVARAGAFVTLGDNGELTIARGYVRPEDEPAAVDPEHGPAAAADDGETGSGSDAPNTGADGDAEPEDADDDAPKPLSERLLSELSACRTLALRDAVAGNPQVALTALLHKLVSDTFQHGSGVVDCLNVSVRHVYFPVQTAELKTSAAASSITARHEVWRADLPQDDAALWAWIEALDEASRLALLAHCVSFGVNALIEKADRPGGSGPSQRALDRRLAQADRLAGAVGLDMAEAGWTPTVDNYLGRVPKHRILEAVREARGEPAAQRIAHLKKADMAQEAEALLAGTGWLPEALRAPSREQAAATVVPAAERRPTRRPTIRTTTPTWRPCPNGSPPNSSRSTDLPEPGLSPRPGFSFANPAAARGRGPRDRIGAGAVERASRGAIPQPAPARPRHVVTFNSVTPSPMQSSASEDDVIARLDAGELARRLAAEAEAVCRRYLSKGRRSGRYWIAGDVYNTPGRSLFVRLTGPDAGPGAAGRWTDAATSQHGDLLDLIGHAIGPGDLATAMDEACAFLSLPRPRFTPGIDRRPAASGTDRSDAARRLYGRAQPICSNVADAYLQRRGLCQRDGTSALRFHPICFYAADRTTVPERRPALIAAVTDLSGIITGVQRTWLAPDGTGKAPVATPRRALGQLLGHAVRFGSVDDVMAAGEGIETVLSLREALPNLPVAAALSASNLAALHLPGTLRRLYIARDDDRAGHRAAAALAHRATFAGIEAVTLSPKRQDFNDDLLAVGPEALRAQLSLQMPPEDVARLFERSTVDRG